MINPGLLPIGKQLLFQTNDSNMCYTRVTIPILTNMCYTTVILLY